MFMITFMSILMFAIYLFGIYLVVRIGLLLIKYLKLKNIKTEFEINEYKNSKKAKFEVTDNQNDEIINKETTK